MTAAAWWLAGLCVKASKLLLGLCGVVGAVLSSFSSLPHVSTRRGSSII